MRGRCPAATPDGTAILTCATPAGCNSFGLSWFGCGSRRRDGVKDYLKHADKLMEDFADVVKAEIASPSASAAPAPAVRGMALRPCLHPPPPPPPPPLAASFQSIPPPHAMFACPPIHTDLH